jgi:YegS/Rv2252/BmrU family lipid kinase
VVEETQRQGDATRIAREAYRKGLRHFIGVGGDGTGYEIVNGLFPEALEGSERPSLGFLPLGTGNSFLRDFTTEGDAYSRRAIREGKLRACDVVRLRCKEGDVYYINILSLGFVADVCTVTNRRFKRFGEAGYGMGVAVKLVELPSRPIPHALDGGPLDTRELAFIVISNSRYTGGKMLISPGAEIANGLAEVTVAEKLDRISFVKTFPKIFDGSHLGHPALTSGRARKIEFKVDRIEDAMIDGEVIPVWPTELEVIAGALEVRA